MTTLLAAVDSPADGERCGRAVLVSGWAVSPDGSGIRGTVSLDGGPPVPLHPGRLRPDVEAVHPVGGPTAGFGGLVLVGDGPPEARLDVLLADDGGRQYHVRRTVTRGPSPAAQASRVDFDEILVRWLCMPVVPEDAFPRATVGATQLRDALDLSGSFGDLDGPGRFAYLEWLYHLWKNDGDDAIPLALVTAVWLPDALAPPPALPADWVGSTWGHVVLPWLNDDVDVARPDRPLLSRAALLQWSRQPRLRRRFPDPLDVDRGSLTSWLAGDDGGLAAHPELAAPLASGGIRRRRLLRRTARDVTANVLNASLAPRALPDRSSWTRSRRVVGLNVVGHLRAGNGLGEATRCTLRTAIATGLPLDVLDLGPNTPGAQVPEVGPPGHPCSYAVSVIHDNAAHATTALRLLGRRFLLDRCSVGYWYWEAAEPPEGTAEASSHLDEIWVASEFVAGALRPASVVPVHVVPPAVDLEPSPPLERSSLGIPHDTVCFLTMASVNSVLERKNPFGTIEAFRRAFAGRGGCDAILVLKLNGLHAAPSLRAELSDRIAGLPVVVVDWSMTRAEVRSLVAMSDVTVSLHRAEGFGLPLAEAMAAGRATIATAWSGNTDFTSPATAFAVPYQLVPIDVDLGPYRRGMHWAEPDLDAAAEAMWRAATDEAHRETIAASGRRFVREHYDARALAPLLRAHVERLGPVTS